MDCNVDATDYQECRSISATCDSGGVIGLNIDPTILNAQDYASEPTLTIVGGDGVDFAASLIYDSGLKKVTGFTIDDPGSGYTTIPTVTISPSDTSVELDLIVVVGCDTFEYTCCSGGDAYIGYVNVGQTTYFCVYPVETVLDPFVPGVANTIGNYSFIVEGCCSLGSGTTKYSLTFNSPDETLYPFLDVFYSIPGANACLGEQRLYDGRTIVICAVTDTLTAASFSTESPVINPVDNNWLFTEYLDIVVIATPC